MRNIAHLDIAFSITPYNSLSRSNDLVEQGSLQANSAVSSFWSTFFILFS